MAERTRRDLTAAVRSGDRLAGLEALRDAIADDLDACPTAWRDRNKLYYRLIKTLLEIEEARKASAPAESALGDRDAIDRLRARRQTSRWRPRFNVLD